MQIRVKIILGYMIFYLYTHVKIISGYLYMRVRVQIACSTSSSCYRTDKVWSLPLYFSGRADDDRRSELTSVSKRAKSLEANKKGSKNILKIRLNCSWEQPPNPRIIQQRGDICTYVRTYEQKNGKAHFCNLIEVSLKHLFYYVFTLWFQSQLRMFIELFSA